MKLLRILLYPFVPVYALIVKIRNLFFDKNIFKPRSVNAKIISVGNLIVGGSGKTPAVIYLTNLLKHQGKKVGVLSRGYGRKSKGYVLVSRGEEILTSVDVCGDEIYHTVQDCRVPAAVSEKRVGGVEKLVKETGVDTIVLDDAFQHRWIKRNLDILIFDQSFLNEKNFFTHNLLPTGYLRESFKETRRSDAVIVNRKFSEIQEINPRRKKYLLHKPVFTAHYRAVCFVDVAKKIQYAVEDFRGQKSLIVSGIANPDSFISALRQTHIDTDNRLIFRDHKDYTLKDIQLIRKQFYSTNSHSVLTTEKDAVKLTNFKNEFDDIEIFYLKIELRVDDEISFKDFILEKIS
ncbi:MAG: tetraacyldisaccharide 4'-kinase [Ignavibacteriaceae bacterium]|nr:tetraacyldisaccharide 4'-kinase [Ignavibacteriaceae bacterium]